MKTKDLKLGYSIYGNKGAVWDDKAHIYESNHGVLCGTPALSSNWAKAEEMDEANCPECNKLYREEN